MSVEKLSELAQRAAEITSDVVSALSHCPEVHTPEIYQAILHHLVYAKETTTPCTPET